jgi:AcrR family transcriptional regulator
MAEIAKEAGMSVGQIYRYFASKEALIAKIVDRETDRTLQLVEAAFAAGEDKAATLVGQVPAALARSSDPKYAKLMLEVAAEAARNLDVAAALQIADKAARVRFRLMMAAVNEPDCDPDEIDARIEVLSLLFEGVPWRLVRNPTMDLAHLSGHLRRLVADLILIAPKPAS